jgi:FlaA1/EpsC-like NDP-sugar epimerase
VRVSPLKLGKAVLQDGFTRAMLVRLASLGRHAKRGLLVVNDLFVLNVVLWLCMVARYGAGFLPPDWPFALVTGLAPFLTVATFAQFGIYRMVTRFMGAGAFNRIAGAVALSVLIWSLIIFLSGVAGVPRMAVLLYAVFGTLGIWASRQVAGWLLKQVGVPILRDERNRIPVLVYGAGRAGLELANALERSERYSTVGFVDRTPTLWGQYAGGYKIYRPDRLAGLVDRFGIKEVMLALPQSSRQERLSILQELQALPVAVRTLPGLDDIASGRVLISALRSVEATDLLGRDPVPPDRELLTRNTAAKVVMVTGAGGSIGSELARQIIRQRPSRLVLVELSENALYRITSEATEIEKALRAADPQAICEIAPVLGSVLNRAVMAETLAAHRVETIYHAAAYKHVPIVEANVAVGIENNALGTLVLAEAAAAAGVERFVLVSTDKAVRPSSAMGASKRLAELALQALAAKGGHRTVFTIVRFGNVLDSSGSVVQLFRKQIERGGPVTVTHRDMIRYFMSIPEAASLVIQAGAMARGGEVFVLDMGEPVRIDDLARSMVRHMGLDVRDAENPNGDIEIAYVGLRPGERLKEELLIGSDTTGTVHPRIQTSREPFVPYERLRPDFTALGEAIAAADTTAIEVILARTVEDYRSTSAAESATADTTHPDGWPQPVSRALH